MRTAVICSLEDTSSLLRIFFSYHISAQPVEKLSVELSLSQKGKLNREKEKSSTKSVYLFLFRKNTSADIEKSQKEGYFLLLLLATDGDPTLVF
jgi:hypothetical protein